MTTNNSNLFDMTLLAEASYVRMNQLEQNFTDEDVKKILKNKDAGGNFTQEQADYFIAHWQVVENGHQPNTDTGYSATLFQSIDDPSHLVYATRGTEFGVQTEDYLVVGVDLGGADGGDIVRDGIALNQTLDMCCSGSNAN